MEDESARPMPGGPLAIDLLNTTWQTGHGLVDWLDDDHAVMGFAAEYDRELRDGDVVAARAELVRTRGLVRRLLDDASSDATTLTDELTREVNEALQSARVSVVSSADGFELRVAGDQPHSELAIEALVDAIELRRERADRVRSCEHDSCVLWFLDTSKGGRRRWCSMERCGNRAKAQRHYRRTTQSTD